MPPYFQSLARWKAALSIPCTIPLQRATFLFPVGSLVGKLSLINSAGFLSLEFSVYFYNMEAQERGLGVR